MLSRWRGEESRCRGGGFVVNDAYNANPTSMRAALVDLAERAGGRRRVAILGEMAELGDEAGRYHREIGEPRRRARVDVLVAVGERRSPLHRAGRGRHALDPDAAAFDSRRRASSGRATPCS